MTSVRKILIGGAVAGSALLGGAVGATLMTPAGAQPTTDSTTTDSSSTSAPAPADARPAGAPAGPHQANGVTEAPLTGDELASATAAAQAAEPDGTVERAETDAEGAAYEVHMELADGSHVTIKLDADFNVTETIDGFG